jgi:hypothetical protein
MSRRLLTAATLATLAAAAAIVPAAPAQAVACTINFTCYTTFYSNSTRTVVVGEKFEDCNGSTTMWGVRSPYSTFSENPC